MKQKLNVCAILTRHILQQNLKRQSYIICYLISDIFREIETGYIIQSQLKKKL